METPMADIPFEWDQDNATTLTPPPAIPTTAGSEPKRAGESLHPIIERMRRQAEDPEWQAKMRRREEEAARKKREFEERQQAYQQEERRRVLLEGDVVVGVKRGVGARYRDCTLANYRCDCDAQTAVVKRLREYAEKIPDHVRRGDGLILFGPAGVGKDHLMVALAKLAVEHRLSVRWENGADLYADVRECIRDGSGEGWIVDSLASPAVLCISDPVPPTGPITPFQSEFLFRVLDRRYRECKPTWLTCNVSSRTELEERLGPQNADRLCHGALTVHCDWPTWRKTQ
jgi:DNA replication protein DnaC